MPRVKEQAITNAKGEQVGVFLDLETWKSLIEELEELDDLRAFDQAIAEKSDPLPLDEALAEIERARSGA